MQQLTGLDAAFLTLDSPTAYGHVGSVSVLDPPAGGEALTLERLTELIESRLHLVPPFRRRLVEVPFGLDQPYWIEDPDFDIEFHVRELALPAPGNDRQLAVQAARLHARPLDRRRPLWETYLIHGLLGGRQALYTKVHHAAIDGVSGNDLLATLMDTSPEPRDMGEPDSWRPETQPGAAKLLVRSAASLVTNPVRAVRFSAGIVRSLPALVGSPARPWLPLIDRYVLRRDRGVVLSAPALIAPATPFNKNIGPHRRWAFTSLPLAQVKEIKNAAGVTVNDVVMALCADLLTDIAQFSMPALANQANRLATRLRLLERVPPFNLVISNVPGPNVDLYLCGARLDGMYPLSAIADGQGLNLTVLGSKGKLNFGALADRDLVPDVEMIIDALKDELVALSDAVGAG